MPAPRLTRDSSRSPTTLVVVSKTSAPASQSGPADQRRLNRLGDAVANRLGVAWGRHPTADDGSWSGYHTAVQAQDLRRHLPLLLQHMSAFA